MLPDGWELESSVLLPNPIRVGGRLPLRGLYSTAWQLATATGQRARLILRARSSDTLFVQKAVLPGIEPLLFRGARRRGARVVLDVDDAEYTIGRLRARTIERVGRTSHSVLAGSPEIARWFGARGARVVLAPTPVELPPSLPSKRDPTLIAWTGTPATATNLRLLVDPLNSLRETDNTVKFIALGVRHLPFAPTWWELLEWTPDNEYSILSSASVGVMPLDDTPFNRGKCGYKVLLYGAYGMDAVYSPVGVNRTFADMGLGFPAASSVDWQVMVLKCLSGGEEARLRRARNRAIVEADYREDQYEARLRNVLFGPG